MPASETIFAQLMGTGKRILSVVREFVVARAQGLSLFTLMVVVVAALIAFGLVRQDALIARTPFTGELEFFAFFTAFLAVATFLSPHRTSFWVFMSLRALAVGAFVVTSVQGDTSLHLLMIAPLMLEIAVYERQAVALIVNGLVLLMYLTLLLTRGATPMLQRMVTVTSMTFAGALVHLVKFHREQHVVQSERLRNLQDAFDQLTDSNLGLQLYATNAERDSAQRERSRITRELHDAVGYALTNIGMMMRAALVLTKTDPKRLESMLNEALELSGQALEETRQTLYRLRAIHERPYQGIWAISRLVNAYRIATKVDVEVHYGNVEWSLGDEIDSVFYRIVQEGLTNAYRHGGANKIRIIMWVSNDEVVLKIWDNGAGAEFVNEGIGLSGMRERLKEVYGSLSAASVPDGFELIARVPWMRKSERLRGNESVGRDERT